jgi:serine/threonine protein kinase/tetratricopeptide (TPR) repeat protein
MAILLAPGVVAVCSICGEPLNAKGDCLVCLLRTGLDKSAIETKPDTSFVFGDYDVLEEIGRGGQAVVYRARQKSLNRIVALKVIGLGHWESTPHLKRFRHEAEAAASLEHPQIVPIYEIGESEGSCYFSMKFVEGGPLAEVLKHDPMSTRRAAELLAKIARTVHYAHQHGILHRDIKPGNILLDRQGEPHLTDFGLARLLEQESTITHSSDVLGTPSYMSPEQAAGRTKELTAATDVYSLGAVFYQMLTSEPPFVGGTTYETIRLVLDSEPRNPRVRNPKIDRDLSTISLKCLEKDPKRRYSSALALAEDLEHWLKHEPIQARRTGLFGSGMKWVRRNPGIAVMAALLLALAVPLGVMIWKGQSQRSPASNPAVPEKSIAVLPFENLSNVREDASFSDGIQDDLLTKLAKIADLKVISRASVMEYRGKHDLGKIGRALRVAHVLQGSVRKAGAWLHINAQLIDTRTDVHLWAEQYDCDLKDMFAIQSEIAQKVARQLQAKTSFAEKLSIERAPTADFAAFDLYTRARLLLMTNFRSNAKAKLVQAADLLNQAIAHDPSFFQAYCQLTFVHDTFYFFGHDHTPARLALAEAALQAASRLRPDAGEMHLARAWNLYRGYGDYDRALAELEIAGQSLPNDPEVFALKGYIQRRQGDQDESLRNLERAIDLDPRNFLTLQQVAISYGSLKRYAEETAALERALAIEPNDVNTKVALASVQFHSKADTLPLHQAIDSIRATNPDILPNIAFDWMNCALAERDSAPAKDGLDAFGDIPVTDLDVNLTRRLMEGVIARMIKDEGKAHTAFTAALAEQEKIVRAEPNYAPAFCVLGLINAGLGRKDEALREGRRAVELLPIEKDALIGKHMIEYLAMIAAWVGDKDLACEQLAIAARPPSDVSYGKLKLMPWWDPLRGDPCFEKIVASLAPK